MQSTLTREAPVRFPERFRLRAPRGLSAALELAAERHHTSPSEYARQALLKGLEADGLSLRDGAVAPTPESARGRS
jgi:predicted HicB family RNase H-like nuclease